MITGDLEIEKRPYGPDSTVAEIAAIKRRVYLHEGNIFMLREMPLPTLFHIDHFDAKLQALTVELDSFALLIDLSAAIKPPSALIRARLRLFFDSHTKIRTVAVFTGKNFLLSIAAKFVFSSAPFKWTVHISQEQALEELRDAT